MARGDTPRQQKSDAESFYQMDQARQKEKELQARKDRELNDLFKKDRERELAQKRGIQRGNGAKEAN